MFNKTMNGAGVRSGLMGEHSISLAWWFRQVPLKSESSHVVQHSKLSFITFFSKVSSFLNKIISCNIPVFINSFPDSAIRYVVPIERSICVLEESIVKFSSFQRRDVVCYGAGGFPPSVYHFAFGSAYGSLIRSRD